VSANLPRLEKDGTPFEGGVFFVAIKVSEDYPFHPPRFRLMNKVFHPNIGPKGNIHVDILESHWSPVLTIPMSKPIVLLS